MLWVGQGHWAGTPHLQTPRPPSPHCTPTPLRLGLSPLTLTEGTSPPSISRSSLQEPLLGHVQGWSAVLVSPQGGVRAPARPLVRGHRCRVAGRCLHSSEGQRPLHQCVRQCGPGLGVRIRGHPRMLVRSVLTIGKQRGSNCVAGTKRQVGKQRGSNCVAGLGGLGGLGGLERLVLLEVELPHRHRHWPVSVPRPHLNAQGPPLMTTLRISSRRPLAPPPPSPGACTVACSFSRLCSLFPSPLSFPRALVHDPIVWHHSWNAVTTYAGLVFGPDVQARIINGASDNQNNCSPSGGSCNDLK